VKSPLRFAAFWIVLSLTMPAINHGFLLCGQPKDSDAPAILAGFRTLVANPDRVRDARHFFDRSRENRPAEEAELERRFMAARLWLLAESGTWDSIDAERLGYMLEKAGMAAMSERDITCSLENGGIITGLVGYGAWFYNNSLLWTDVTAILQNMIVPRTPGGDVYTWLYNTTTNRSNLGVEAFISYYAQSDFHFKVYDWARPQDPWQTDIPYDQLGEYVYDAQNPDGVWRQLLQVINATEQHTLNNWTNRVYLYNRVHEAWDLVYEYAYTTTNPSQNTFEPNDFFGSWGPIFETFQDHDGSNTPIGFDDCWMYQDGIVSKLTPDNSWIDVQDPSLSPPIFLVPNSSWAVGSTDGEPVSQVFEAEAGDHEIGRLYGDYWVAGPAAGEGWMLRGPSWTLPAGRLNAEFLVGIASVSGPDDPVCLVGVWDATLGSYAASDTLTRSDFAADLTAAPFRYDFNAVDGYAYEFVVYSFANVALGIDRVVIVKN
jgi:hypothetical protein